MTEMILLYAWCLLRYKSTVTIIYSKIGRVFDEAKRWVIFATSKRKKQG